MKKYIKPLVLLYLIIITPILTFPVQAQPPHDYEEQDPVLVGRISHVEGLMSRYDPESDRWVSTTREAPFGVDDLLRSDPDARAEILLPNNTWIRMDGDTRLQMTALTQDITEVDLPFGTGRFYNKSDGTELNVTTPFGRITAPPGSAFDLYVGEEGIDIVAVRDSVFFFHNASSRRHEVREDSAAISADMASVSAMPDNGDPDWAAWNRSMDALWADRMASRGKSTTYLPPELHSEAHALDEHGHWERVHYEGRYYRFWRPTHIGVSWSPFSWGAWIVWHGDHVWVPHEPFGWVTHHYGNWIHTAGHWYWAPPVTRIMVQARLPLLHIGFGWYPGRVTWIHSGAHVGWIPLAPYEPYYTHRHWGRRSIVAASFRHHHRHHVYKHRRHAVVIHRSHFYRSNNYRHARIRGISHTTIHKKYRRARVLDRKVMKDHRHNEKRDRFHRKHRRNHHGPSKEFRHNRDRKQYARHFKQKDRHRNNQRRDAVKRDLKSENDRHKIKRQRTRRTSQQEDKGLRANRPPGKQRLNRGSTKAHRKNPSKEIRERRHRRSQDESAASNKVRRADASRSQKQKEVRSSGGRKIDKRKDRPSSTRLNATSDRRKTDRRSTKVASNAKRQRPYKAFNARSDRRKTKGQRNASQHHERHRAKKESVHRRTPSQTRQREVNRTPRRTTPDWQNRGAGYQKRPERMAARPAPAQRPRQDGVRMPTARRAPDRALSSQHNRPQRGGQGWRPSTGRRHSAGVPANRSRSGGHRAQRR